MKQIFLISSLLFSLFALRSNTSALEDAPFALELPPAAAAAEVLDTFSFLSKQNMHTPVLVRPDASPDWLRLAIATGSPTVPLIDLGGDIARQIDQWEAAAGFPPQFAAYPPEEESASGIAELRSRGCTALALPPGLTRIRIDAGAVAALKQALAAGKTPYELPAPEVRAEHMILIDPGSQVEHGRALRDTLRQAGWKAVMTHGDEALIWNAEHNFDTNHDGLINQEDHTLFRAQYAYYASIQSGRWPAAVALREANGANTVLYPCGAGSKSASRRLAAFVYDHWRAADSELEINRECTEDTFLDRLAAHYAAAGEPPPFAGVLIRGNGLDGDAISEWARAEAALRRAAQIPYYSDPPELTPEQIEALVAGEVQHGSTGSPPRMTFTFDLGTTARLWPKLRPVLRENHIATTFFLTGDFIRANPEVVRQMLADGHDMQNHSDTHPNFTQMSAAGIQAELKNAQAALDEALGAHLPMRLWRAPFGARSYETNRAAAEIGMLGVWWSRTGDTTGWQEGATADEVYYWVTSNFQPGQIYVAHLNSIADIEAFPRIVEAALAQGYELGNLWDTMSSEQIALVTLESGG